MFDQKSQHTSVGGNDIDFLHGEDGGVPKQRRVNEPPELAHTSESPSKEFIDLKPRVSFFQKIANVFKGKKTYVQAVAPTTAGAGVEGNGALKRKQDTVVPKTTPDHPSVRIVSPKQVAPQGGAIAVDPFEVEVKETKEIKEVSESLPREKMPVVFAQASQVVPSQPLEMASTQGAGISQKERVQSTSLKTESFGRLKKVPLSEFVSSSLREVKGGSGEKGKEQADQETAQGNGLFDVNLLPAQKKRFSLKAKKMFCLVSVSVEFLVLLLLFLLWQARADGRMLGLRELESKSTILDIQTKGYRPIVSGATDLQKKVKALNTLFAERKDVTRALAWLEANTIKTVFYENFSATAEGKFSVGVVASNVTEAAQQLKVFLNAPEWKLVEVKGLLIREDEEGGTLVSYVIEAIPVQEFYSPVRK